MPLPRRSAPDISFIRTSRCGTSWRRSCSGSVTARRYPLNAIAPAQPSYPDPWAENSDPQWNDQPELLTYNRFFQHTMKFLGDNGMFDELVFTLGVSSSLYVATNAYGLTSEQLPFVGGLAVHWL